MPYQSLIYPNRSTTAEYTRVVLSEICVLFIALSDEALVQSMLCCFMHMPRSLINSGPLRILVKMSDRLSRVGM